MNYKNVNKVARVLFFIAFALILMMNFTKDLQMFYLTSGGSVVCMLSAFLVKHLYYRCPHCKHKFNNRAAVPKKCPGCGAQLRD